MFGGSKLEIHLTKDPYISVDQVCYHNQNSCRLLYRVLSRFRENLKKCNSLAQMAFMSKDLALVEPNRLQTFDIAFKQIFTPSRLYLDFSLKRKKNSLSSVFWLALNLRLRVWIGERSQKKEACKSLERQEWKKKFFKMCSSLFDSCTI